jgi:hypothetical protein
MRALKGSKSLQGTGENMSEKGPFLSRLWSKQHGRQYAISAIGAGSSGVALVLCAYQLLFLQDHAEWNDFTGFAIVGAVVSLIILLVSFPEFLRFRGHVATVEEIMELQSTAELRRRKADGVLAAEALGAGHLEHWNAFLESKGLRR